MNRVIHWCAYSSINEVFSIPPSLKQKSQVCVLYWWEPPVPSTDCSVSISILFLSGM